MRLTKQEAKRLAEKYLLDNKTKNGKFLYAHTKGVVEAAKLLAKRERLDGELLEISAWVHDIGYSLENEMPHAENSLKILEKEGFEIDDIMNDCILNHGNSGKPKIKEGELMQIADKISIINKDFLEILLKNKIGKEEIEFIKIMFNKSLDMLEKLR